MSVPSHHLLGSSSAQHSQPLHSPQQAHPESRRSSLQSLFPDLRSPSPLTPTEDGSVEVMKCHCGWHVDNDDTIYCPACGTWRHIKCAFPASSNTPHLLDFGDLPYACKECDPNPTVGLVEHIVRKELRFPSAPQKIAKKIVHYLVKRDGHGIDKCTWQTAASLPAGEVEAFERASEAQQEMKEDRAGSTPASSHSHRGASTPRHTRGVAVAKKKGKPSFTRGFEGRRRTASATSDDGSRDRDVEFPNRKDTRRFHPYQHTSRESIARTGMEDDYLEIPDPIQRVAGSESPSRPRQIPQTPPPDPPSSSFGAPASAEESSLDQQGRATRIFQRLAHEQLVRWRFTLCEMRDEPQSEQSRETPILNALREYGVAVRRQRELGRMIREFDIAIEDLENQEPDLRWD